MKVQGIAAIAVVAIAIAACGGGGGGGSAPSGSVAVVPTTAPSNAALPAGYLVDAVTVNMPKGSYSTTSVRRAQNVGAGTESIVFTLLQQNGQTVTGTAQPFGLVQTSPGCSVNANTLALSCVLPVDAPIGQDIFLAQTYDNAGGQNGTGNLTGSGAVALSVGQNTSNTASIVLSAQVSSVYVVAGGTLLGNAGYLFQDFSSSRGRGAQALRKIKTALPPGSVASLPIFVVAADNLGNIILNPSAYNSPLYLQLEYDPMEGNIEFFEPTTPDVTLTVNYSSSDPSPCTPGGVATASNFYDSVAVCSPSDSVTATLSATGGSNPSQTAYVFGYTSVTQVLAVPEPSPLPVVTPTNNSFTYFTVGYPTPIPCPTGQGCLPVTVQ